MDAYSYGEELVIKTRKPYTITKQRERWTEEEHNRFLEALKLYGRAWQRIEEHIGTKTAVQIRSHAQKFFSKLEKEALVKGVPIGKAIDIEIPPPRPKRKPSNPYPRKTGAASSPNTQVRIKDGKQVPSGSSHTTKHIDLEKELLPEKTAGDDGKQNANKENCPGENCSETFTLFQEAHSMVAASANENSVITMDAARPVPMKKQLTDVDVANGPTRNQKANKPVTMETAEDTENEMRAAKNFPRHATVQILDGSLGACSQVLSSYVLHQESPFHQMEIPGHPVLFSTPAVSAAVESQNSTSRSTNHQMFPSFHPPFTPLPKTQEDYSSYLQMSSTFSSLIVSSLLQNPTAHAAASFATSFWPGTSMESSSNCPAGTNGGLPPRSVNAGLNMAAIAAATVAAATAWWAAHGLLPLCAPPLHAGFTCPPASVTAPLTNVAQPQAVNVEREENNFQNPNSQVEQPDQEISEALQPQDSASKSSATSSSNSGNSAGAKMKTGLVAINDNEKKVPAMTEQKESSKGKSKKQVDRSSCGSNSGSDIETDALEKNDKKKEE